MTLLGMYINFVEWLEAHMLTCPSKKYLHIDCPGCGLQRGIVALMKGDVAESLSVYPAALPIVLMFGYLILYLLFRFKKGEIYLRYMFIGCSSIILVHYIYRLITRQIF